MNDQCLNIHLSIRKLGHHENQIFNNFLPKKTTPVPAPRYWQLPLFPTTLTLPFRALTARLEAGTLVFLMTVFLVTTRAALVACTAPDFTWGWPFPAAGVDEGEARAVTSTDGLPTPEIQEWLF